MGVVTDVWADVMITRVPGMGVNVLAEANVHVLGDVMTVLQFAVSVSSK